MPEVSPYNLEPLRVTPSLGELPLLPLNVKRLLTNY